MMLIRSVLCGLALGAATILAVARPAQAIEFQYQFQPTRVSTDVQWNSTYSAEQRADWGPPMPAMKFWTPVNSYTLFDDSGILLAAIGGGAGKATARRQAEESARRSGKKAGDSFSYSYESRFVGGAKSYLRYASGKAANPSISFDDETFDDYVAAVSYTALDFGAALPEVQIVKGFSLSGIWEVWVRMISLDKPVTPKKPPPGFNPYLGHKDEMGIHAPLSIIANVWLPLGFVVRPSVGYDVVSALNVSFADGHHGFVWGVNGEWSPGKVLRLVAGINGMNGDVELRTPYRMLTFGMGAGLFF